MSDLQSRWITLDSGALRVEVDPLGAQLSALRDADGRDLLWDGDPSVWSGRAPLLFPIVGALAGGHYRLDARWYPLPRHGFARTRRFDVMRSTPTRALFRLGADESTRQVYPFEFELTVQFELHGSTLSITTHVCNLGDVEMPASVGYHPAFRWPLPFGYPRLDHVMEFAAEEPGPMRRLNAGGLLTSSPYSTPIVHRHLSLADELFQQDVMIFDQLKGHSVAYGAGPGPRLVIDYPDAAYLGIWSKPGAPFVCIEPWRGIADPEGFAGDFRTKPGVFLVAPGAAIPITLSIRLQQPGRV
jgi:galactose mutarotase-like enzyme